MVLTVHHLGRSQSERIVWLCEELNLDYQLKVYDRSPLLAPPELKKLHPLETAPIIIDGDITLAESGAIVEHILVKYGRGRLQLKPDDKNFPDYLYWLHFANGTLQSATSLNLFIKIAKVSDDNPALKAAQSRREHSVKLLDDRLKDNEWLAGQEFTAADIMTVVSVTTMRLFVPYGLGEYPHLVGYLERVGKREGYRRAMEKGDPGLTPLLSKDAPRQSLL